MSTPRRRPESTPPHASRDAKLLIAKGQSENATGTGIGEAPHSLRYKLSIFFVIVVLLVMLVTVFTDAASSKPKTSGPAPTIAIPPDETP